MIILLRWIGCSKNTNVIYACKPRQNRSLRHADTFFGIELVTQLAVHLSLVEVKPIVSHLPALQEWSWTFDSASYSYEKLATWKRGKRCSTTPSTFCESETKQ